MSLIETCKNKINENNTNINKLNGMKENIDYSLPTFNNVLTIAKSTKLNNNEIMLLKIENYKLKQRIEKLEQIINKFENFL